MWSTINTLKARDMEHEERRIKVSPKLDRRGAQKKVQCTHAIKAAEALLPGAQPKIDVEKVCCKVAGKQVFVADITQDNEKFIWRTDDIKTALRVDLSQEHIDRTMERLDNEHRAAREMRFQPPGITFVTWNTCGSVDLGVIIFLERTPQVSSWSFGQSKSTGGQNAMAGTCVATDCFFNRRLQADGPQASYSTKIRL